MRWEQMGDEKRYEFAMRRMPQTERGVKVGKNCSIDPRAVIGSGTVIEDNVVVRGNVQIGRCCHLKSHSSLGSKGFSFGFDNDGLPYPIYHEGSVRIGDYVEIGTHTHVACATMKEDNTIIEDHVKIDDSIHVAHNCHIKEGAVVTAGVTFGGGVVIGKRAWIGLGAIIKNRVKIGDFVLVGAGANVVSDVPDASVVVGNPAKVVRQRKNDKGGVWTGSPETPIEQTTKKLTGVQWPK